MGVGGVIEDEVITIFLIVEKCFFNCLLEYSSCNKLVNEEGNSS